MYKNDPFGFVCRACQFWSAPYDGINPSPQQNRYDTPGYDIEDEEELIERLKSNSVCSLTVFPPLTVLSPTPSSSDTVSTSNQAGRVSSAMDLEWDDIFEDEDLSSSAVCKEANGCVETDRCAFSPAPPPLPPQYIQEMRRTASKLVQGSYVEESEFQDDVIVYDLVAQKDTKAAMLEQIKAANRQSHESVSKSAAVSAMLTATGKSVMETVNSIMSSRRRSEDGGKEDRRKSEDYKEARRRSEGFGKELGRTQEEGEEEIKKTQHVITNGFDVKNHIISISVDISKETESFQHNYNSKEDGFMDTIHQKQTHPNTSLVPCLEVNCLPNGHFETEPQELCVPSTNTQPDNKSTKDNFVSQYCKLMLSLGVEPDCDDITDDIRTFSRRVQALRQKLQEEEEELITDFGYSSSWDDAEEEGEYKVMEEEEEDNKKGGSRKQEVPFTGECL